ncbi:hypothetical protein ACILFS_00880 [Capnocytophaga canimorsus]|uniref:hypothetical protein n=1 Tax=Capnocytophaga canimorsus TaxID=28188 RepID=UPI0037CF5EBC
MKEAKNFLKHLMEIEECKKEAYNICFDYQGKEREVQTEEELQKLKELFSKIIVIKKKMNRDYSEESSIVNDLLYAIKILKT